MALTIPEIACLPSAIQMKREVLRRAIKLNLTENDVWFDVETYQKSKKDKPGYIGKITVEVLSRFKKSIS